MPNPFQTILSQVFGHASRQYEHADPQATFAVRLVGRIQEHVFGRWAVAQQTRLPCAVAFTREDPNGREVTPCHNAMITACVACGQPVCLEHAAIEIDSGNGICFGCVQLAQDVRQQQQHWDPARATNTANPGAAAPAPSADEVKLLRKYLRMLKLDADADETQIRAAYRREAARAHPDKHPPADKKKAHKRFIELTRARDFLLARCESRAA